MDKNNPIKRGTDVVKLKEEMPCFAVFLRVKHDLSDEYALLDHHGRYAGRAGRKMILPEHRIKRLGYEKILKLTNEKYELGVFHNNTAKEWKLHDDIMRGSVMVFTEMESAYKYAQERYSISQNMETCYAGNVTRGDVAIYKARAQEWILPSVSISNNTYNAHLAGDVTLESLVTTVEEHNLSWLPYPAIHPEAAGSYTVTEEKSPGYDRYVARDARYYDGREFVIHNRRIVAWMPLPRPYKKRMHGEAE